MSCKKFKKYRFLIIVIFVFTLMNTNISYGYSYIQSPNININYEEQGMLAMEKRDYTTAIDYFKKALSKNPSNSYIRNNIAVALNSRATYYYNQKIDLEKSANDYRSALYYLEYYGKYENSETIKNNIVLAKQNLNNVLVAQKAKTDTLSRFKKAKELRGKGELTAAVYEFNEAAKDRQYAYESYVALGDIMKIISNEYNAAIYYDKALAIKDSDANLHLKFGRTLYNLGKIDAAVKELDIASENPKTKNEALSLLEAIWKTKVAQNPKDAIAQMNLGATYQNKGDLSKAMIQYKAAQALEPQNQMIKLNMATLLQKQGKYTEALSIYNNILKNRPNDITVNSYKANTLSEMGKKDEAISIYKKLLINNPNNDFIKKSLLETIKTMPESSGLNYITQLSQQLPYDADVAYTQAFILHKTRNYKEAATYYEKSLSLDKNNLDAYLNLAAIYKQRNELAKAINTLNNAKNVYPQNKKITQMLTEYKDFESFSQVEQATKLYNDKKYEEAISAYKAIQNPTEDIYLGIGACYQALEQYADAIIYYNKAIAIDNSNPTSYYFLGLAYLYQKDYTKAENALKKAMDLDSVNPDIADAYKTLRFTQSEDEMNRGLALIENNKNNEAITLLNKSIEHCAENGYAHYYRGLAYDAISNTQKAISDYKKAIELVPDLAMGYYSLALSYETINNNLEAKKMYEKFVSLYTTQDEYLQYAQKRISEL